VARIRSILNNLVVRIEHVGSTSVDSLPAKPIIDIALEVPDSSDEKAYVPALEAAACTQQPQLDGLRPVLQARGTPRADSCRRWVDDDRARAEPSVI
jgi:GrpB-like predicted nucleotidyltransferase (UPF0157 family)